MREALARSDHDFILAEEPRRKPRAAPCKAGMATGPARPRKAYVSLAFLTQRPGRTIAGAALTALVTGITLNAVMFQTGRHPAPLFGAPQAVVASARTATPAVAPMPAPRPVAPQPAPVAASPAQPSAPPLAARVAETPAAPRAAEPVAARKDPIAALLKGEGVSDPVVPPARVAAVQKALIKTGFVLRADGVMGATTRQALERFEQDRKLPVTGDLSPRTLRELAAQSGVSIP